MFTPLESLVLATVAYTTQFDYPLSQSEICQRCLSLVALKTAGVEFNDRPSSAQKKLQSGSVFAKNTTQAVGRAINKLIQKKYLQTDQISPKTKAEDVWLSLADAWQVKNPTRLSNRHQSAFELRRSRQKLAKSRWTELGELKAMLNASPWVLAAAITGSAAMLNGTHKSDLDVMIITAPGRLWLARLNVLILTWWYKHRNKTGWCFNLWLEPSELGLPPHRQGVYEAYELWQCYWLVDKANWRLAWLGRNKWFKKFLPMASLEPKYFQIKGNESLSQSETWPNWLGEIANSLAYLIQVHYRKWRHGERLAERRQAFLHAPDSRALIYARWQNQLNQLGLIN
jgi:hypothetical protein